MDDTRKERKRFMSGQPRPLRETQKEKKGFAGLDPNAMGLGGPEWLHAASPRTELPPSSAIASEAEGVASTPTLPSDDTLLPATPVEPRSLLEGMKVVCICKGIKKRVFWKVLDAGARSPEEIHRLTGSGNGGCHGSRCGPRILEMLRNRASET